MVASSKERPLISVTSSATPKRARFFFKSLMMWLLERRKCFNFPPASILTIFFRHTGFARAIRCGNRRSSDIRTNLQDISRAEPGEVIDEKQNIHVQHGGGLPDFS